MPLVDRMNEDGPVDGDLQSEGVEFILAPGDPRIQLLKYDAGQLSEEGFVSKRTLPVDSENLGREGEIGRDQFTYSVMVVDERYNYLATQSQNEGFEGRWLSEMGNLFRVGIG